MSAFEHLMTLGSFVLALGIGAILNFGAVLVHHRRSAKTSAAHLCWVAAILCNQLSFWLGSFLFHNDTHADIFTLGYVVLSPLVLYAQGALAVTDGGETMDVAAHHDQSKRIYLSLMLVSLLLDIVFFYAMSQLRPELVSSVPGWRLDYTLGQNLALAACVIAGLVFRGGLHLVAAIAYLAIRVVTVVLSSVPLIHG
jgi:hypothetical protein